LLEIVFILSIIIFIISIFKIFEPNSASTIGGCERQPEGESAKMAKELSRYNLVWIPEERRWTKVYHADFTVIKKEKNNALRED
jgi:hypothetical protein